MKEKIIITTSFQNFHLTSAIILAEAETPAMKRSFGTPEIEAELAIARGSYCAPNLTA
jgi:hypothetical protein